ncbi:MAG: outer membrane lipoprotein carrier protein LolA [Flavobacteriaceae bacterium]|nr:outer membrane lipoprotein carrier protein LolA [Flavobacteriaceae bacterium]
MKKLFNPLFLAILFLVLTVQLQAQNDQKANEMVGSILEKVKSYENISIEFTYVLENLKENIKQETRGEVTIQNDKYVLNLMGTTRIFDGKKIYTIIPEDEEVIISNYDDQDENEITPSKMLTFFEEGYSYEMDIVQNYKGRKIQFLKLIPNEGTNDEIKEILLGVDQQTLHLHTLIQIQDNGTRTQIQVKSFKRNQPLSQKHFEFNEDKYSNYYINRLD